MKMMAMSEMFCIVVERALHDPSGHYAYRIGCPAPFVEPILFDTFELATRACKLWNSSQLWQFKPAKVSKKLCQEVRKKLITVDKTWQKTHIGEY